MDSATNRKTLFYCLLIGVGVAGIVLRCWGLNWGLHYGEDRNMFQFNTDEMNLVQLACRVAAPEFQAQHAYVRGFPQQVASLLGMYLLTGDHAGGIDEVILIGRWLSIFYAALTIAATFLLGKEILGQWEGGFWAALFLSSFGLHVTNSHFFTTDVTNTFWMLAVMVLAFTFVKKPSLGTLLLCSAACGFSIATKFMLFSLIPLIACCLKARRAKWLGLGLPFALLTALFINGFSYSWQDFRAATEEFLQGNVLASQHHPRLQNPLMYFLALIPGLGAPAFAMLCWRACRSIGSFLSDMRSAAGAALSRIFRGACLWIVFLPLVLYSLVILSFGFVSTRHMVVLTPALACLAAGGIMLVRNRTIRRVVGFVSVAYCFVNTAGIEFWYANETRAAAWDYIREEIPGAASVHFSRYMPVPEGYANSKIPDAQYLVLHESYYRRYLRSLNSPFLRNPVDDSHVVHGTRGHLGLYINLFRGKTRFRLMRRFPIRLVTPESRLCRSLFGWPPDLLGEVRIYRRGR